MSRLTSYPLQKRSQLYRDVNCPAHPLQRGVPAMERDIPNKKTCHKARNVCGKRV